MYYIRVYAGENLHHETTLPTASMAINKAYDAIEGYPFRVAHIIKVGSDHGIYIARPDDRERRGWDGIDGAIRQLEATKWSL